MQRPIWRDPEFAQYPPHCLVGTPGQKKLPETLTGDEIIALLKGIPPVRAPYEEPEPQRGPGPSVPVAGRPRTIGPIAPEPQPGR